MTSPIVSSINELSFVYHVTYLCNINLIIFKLLNNHSDYRHYSSQTLMADEILKFGQYFKNHINVVLWQKHKGFCVSCRSLKKTAGKQLSPGGMIFSKTPRHDSLKLKQFIVTIIKSTMQKKQTLISFIIIFLSLKNAEKPNAHITYF